MNMLASFHHLTHDQQYAKVLAMLLKIEHKHPRFAALARFLEQEWATVPGFTLEKIYAWIFQIAEQLTQLSLLSAQHEYGRVHHSVEELRRKEALQKIVEWDEDALLEML
jgi:hypothetical protein